MSITKEPLKASLEAKSLEDELKKLLTGFTFNGKTIKNSNDDTIDELLFENELTERYRNPSTTPNLDVEVEDILPFVDSFNEKRFWWIKPPSSNIHLIKGQRLVFQDGQSIIVNAGEYLDGGFLGTPKKSNNIEIEIDEPDNNFIEGERFVYLYRNKKLDIKRENYYINVEGEYAIKMFDKPVVRFYFHLSPNSKEDILEWAAFIQNALNKYRIPFGFKYPFNLKNYRYSDAGVLYINQNHFPLVAPIIQQVANKYSQILSTNVPLFTFKLYDGIGFAESPFSTSESFGSHRRKLIRKIISDYNSYTENSYASLDSDEIITEITNKLNKDYPNGLYRNAQTNFEYNFQKHFSSEFEIDATAKNFEYDLQKYLASKIEVAITTKDLKEWLKNIADLILAKYREWIDDFGRMRFLSIAENYGKDLVEKAIWDPEDDVYTWLTYDEYTNEDGEKQGFYRTICDTEKNQIKSFFLHLHVVTDDVYYKNAANKIKVEEAECSSQENEKQVKLDEIYQYLHDDHDKKFVEIVVEIQNKIDGLHSSENLSIEDLKKGAKIIDKYFEKLSLPMKNRFGNYEYCPNYNGKLKIAFLFLLASKARSLKELIAFYQELYNDSSGTVKSKLEQWKKTVKT